MLGSDQLKNTYDFRYLGMMFQSDCCMLHAVEVRLAVARERFNKLSNIWNSPLLSRRVKLQLYECAVCSIMSHGHESWKLDVRTMAKINGWNARCLSILSGRSVHEEARWPSVDLVSALRVRRLSWLGHILRRDDTRLTKRVLMLSQQPYRDGSLMMDAPPHASMDELQEIAQDRGEWTNIVNALERRLLGAELAEKTGRHVKARRPKRNPNSKPHWKLFGSEWKLTTLTLE